MKPLNKTFALALIILASAAGTTRAYNLDIYGGMIDIHMPDGQNTKPGYWHSQRYGNRWFFLDPLGNAFFPRQLSKVDDGQGAPGTGSFIPYDAVYLSTGSATQEGDAASFVNRTTEAASGFGYSGDVIHPATGVTLKNKNDAIFLGWKLPPINSYFWVDQPGQGGTITWYYSAGGGTWKPLPDGQQPGQPTLQGYKNFNWLNNDGSYYLDADPAGTGFMGPLWQATQRPSDGAWFYPGSYTWSDISTTAVNTNMLKWFYTDRGLPSDFVPMGLAADPTPRYYIKGVVQQAFTGTGAQPPILSQLYEREKLSDTIARKYGAGSGGNFWSAWADAQTQRMHGWGLNAVGMYSFRYTIYAPNPMPMTATWQLSGWTLRHDQSYRYMVKSVYSPDYYADFGARDWVGWPGTQADVFEPEYQIAINELVATNLPLLNQNPHSDSIYELITEEGDDLYGMDALSHPHMGFIVLTQSPYQTHGKTINYGETTYPRDGIFYAKYALRDFLRFRYKDADDPIRPWQSGDLVPAYSYATSTMTPSQYETHALQNLNQHWGTNYSNWVTSSLTDPALATSPGDWPHGNGFMDEEGQNVENGQRFVSYNDDFTNPGNPPGTIRKDLDDFVALAARQYGTIVRKAFDATQLKYPALAAMVYDGPDMVYSNMAPFTDTFQSNVSAGDALRIGNATQGQAPLMLLNYAMANPDSQLYFNSTLHDYTDNVPCYDGHTCLSIYAPGLKYEFRGAGRVSFGADADACLGGPGKYISTPMEMRGTSWDRILVDSNGGATASCLTKDQTPVKFQGWGQTYDASQPARAASLINLWGGLTNQKESGGYYFLAGFEHWSMWDDQVSAPNEWLNTGFVSANDNAYDGYEAMTSTNMAQGYNGGVVGGEQSDYGNLISSTVPNTIPNLAPTWSSNMSLTYFLHTFDDPATFNFNPDYQGAPLAVKSLAVTATTLTPSITLSWQPADSSATGYRVWIASYSFSLPPGTTGQFWNDPTVGKALFPGSWDMSSVTIDNRTFPFLLNDFTYFLNVTAVNSAGDSPFSSEVSTNTVPYQAPASTPVIYSSSFTTGVVGSSFSYAIQAQNYPTQFMVNPPTLPAGLALDQYGIISGTPTQPGVWQGVMIASNSAGFDSEPLAISINDLPAPTLNLPPILPINARIAASYPSGYQVSSFLWTIQQVVQGGSGSGSGSLGQRTSYSGSFRTPGLQADLAVLPLIPGYYSITVQAFDQQGVGSPVSNAAYVTLTPGDLNSLRVFPNPWRSDRDAGLPITFDHLTGGTTLKLFTFSGHGFRSLGTPVVNNGNLSLTWDLKNDSGDKVASGVYFYLATDSAGNKNKGEFAIIK